MLQHKYHIGNFDRQITILQKVVSINEFNGESEVWEILKTKWSKEVSKTGYEGVEADKITALRNTTFVVRYDDSIDVEMRVLWDDQVYNIVSVKQPQGIRKRFLELECEFLEGEVFVEPIGAFTSGFSSGFEIV